MPNNLTNAAENLILDHFLGVANYAFDSTFLLLYTPLLQLIALAEQR